MQRRKATKGSTALVNNWGERMEDPEIISQTVAAQSLAKEWKACIGRENSLFDKW